MEEITKNKNDFPNNALANVNFMFVPYGVTMFEKDSQLFAMQLHLSKSRKKTLWNRKHCVSTQSRNPKLDPSIKKATQTFIEKAFSLYWHPIVYCLEQFRERIQFKCHP